MSNFLPNELLRRLAALETFDQEAFAESHARGDRITSVRLNPDKARPEAFRALEKVPWCALGRYLDERPVFTLDPYYHAGCFYVQEASSMFLDHMLSYLGLKGGEVRALDLCAAPGGKSTLMNTVLGSGSLLVANEVIRPRVRVLEENMVRWGHPNVVVTNNDPSAFGRLLGYFDLLVADAPCSGSGMFRKDKKAVDEWSLANVRLCADRQKRILAAAWPSLKTGGLLVYSTCSYSEEENEDILDWLAGECAAESVRIPTETNWGIEETLSDAKKCFGYRFYPHKLKGEGFFAAVLRKTEEQPTFGWKKTTPEKSNIPKGMVERFVKQNSDFLSFVHNGDIHVFPKKNGQDLKILQQVLYLKNAGTKLGRLSGTELLPAHDLALSNYAAADFPAQEVDMETARDFLRKKDLGREFFPDVRNGWCLVKHGDVPIGWAKVLPNRVNNYYPKEMRIMNL